MKNNQAAYDDDFYFALMHETLPADRDELTEDDLTAVWSHPSTAQLPDVDRRALRHDLSVRFYADNAAEIEMTAENAAEWERKSTALLDEILNKHRDFGRREK